MAVITTAVAVTTALLVTAKVAVVAPAAHGDRRWRCGGIDVVARECDDGPARWSCRGESNGACADCAAHNNGWIQRERGETGRRIDRESGCLGRTVVCAGDCHSRRCRYGLAGDGEGGRGGACGTVTDAGVVAALMLLLASVTTAPPAGAAVARVTAPVLVAPPTTAVGFNASAARPAGGLTVRVAILVAPLYVPVIVTAVAVATALLVTAKVAIVAPAATVTDAGVVAALMLLLASVTAAPPAGAVVARVTVPVLFAPPTTAVGFSANAARPAGGLTVRVAVLIAPLYSGGDCHSRRCCYDLTGDCEVGRRGACGHGDRCGRRSGVDVVAREGDHGSACWSCRRESDGTCAGCAARQRRSDST